MQSMSEGKRRVAHTLGLRLCFLCLPFVTTDQCTVRIAHKKLTPGATKHIPSTTRFSSIMITQRNGIPHRSLAPTLKCIKQYLHFLECLLLSNFAFCGDFETLLGRIEDGLNLFEEAVLLFQLRVGFHRLLNQ